jgi:hypothetical protein
MKLLKKSMSRFINYKLQQNFGFILLATIPLHILTQEIKMESNLFINAKCMC